MSGRSVILVPADRATNVELVTRAATVLAAPGEADVHGLSVMPRVPIAGADMNADVIVMGVAPRTWLDRSMFGSTLERVLRRSEIPTLIIPAVDGEEEWSETTIAEDVMEAPQFTAAGIAA